MACPDSAAEAPGWLLACGQAPLRAPEWIVMVTTVMGIPVGSGTLPI